jgi:hypothetical protein
MPRTVSVHRRASPLDECRPRLTVPLGARQTSKQFGQTMKAICSRLFATQQNGAKLRMRQHFCPG